MPTLQLSQVCTVTPTAAQHTHGHVATNPGSWRNLRHRKGSRKQAATGPRTRPTLSPLPYWVLGPRLTRRFPSNSTRPFCLLLNFTQMESYYTLTGFWCLLVSDFFHSVFFEGWRWGESHHVLHVVVDYSYCNIVGKYYVNTPWCSYLRVFVHLS